MQAETELAQIRLLRIQTERKSQKSKNTEEDLENIRLQLWENNSGDPTAPAAEKELPHQPQPAENEERRKQEEELPSRHSPYVNMDTLAAALTQAIQTKPREAPRYLQELPVFSGHSGMWLAFKAAYRDTEVYFSKIENNARLRRSLRGPALEAVNCLLLSQPDPQKVMEALERRFGRPEALVLVEMEKLKSLPKVSEEPRDLCIFAGKIANTVATVEALEMSQYLCNTELVRLILERLTPILRSKWYDYAAQGKKEKVLPEMKRLSDFLNEEADKCGAYALPERIPEDTRIREKVNFKRKTERSYAVREKNEHECPMCNQEHKLPDCRQFLSIDTPKRWEITKRHRICFRCLRSKHRRDDCRAKPCGHSGCTMKHHRLLHLHRRYEQPTPQDTPPETSSETTNIEHATTANITTRRHAYLKIAPVTLTGPTTSIETYALFDEGSTVTLIDESIADVLGADGPEEQMWIQGISGTEIKNEKSKAVKLKIRGKHQPQVFELHHIRTVERLRFNPQTVSARDLEQCAHLNDIKHELTYAQATPKILIGQDNWELIVTREIRSGRRDQPVASYTLLGWTLHGCRSSGNKPVAFCGHLVTTDHSDPMEQMMKDYFKLESLGIEPKKPNSDPEERALSILEKESRRRPDGRFETGLLWREENVTMPYNYHQALRRLHTLEKKLDRDEGLRAKYEERVNNLLQSGYAEHATTTPVENKTWYLPHFPVVNPEKTKIRLVHDAAARFNGCSLNNMLLAGPDLLQSLPGVVMRFRQHPYAVSADIKEMFMQIKIKHEDRGTPVPLERKRP